MDIGYCEHSHQWHLLSGSMKGDIKILNVKINKIVFDSAWETSQNNTMTTNNTNNDLQSLSNNNNTQSNSLNKLDITACKFFPGFLFF